MTRPTRIASRCLTAIGLAAALPLLTPSPARAAPHAVTSEGITDAIERELRFDRAVPENAIDVSTVAGIVTLKGQVPNLLAKRQAARLAETVKGVRSVSNQLQVAAPQGLSEVRLERDAKNALLYDRGTESYEIFVDVDDGRAKLSGTVQSWQERQLAERVVAGVRGIVAIDNDISVEYEAERPDTEIRRDVLGRLRWDALVDHPLISVTVSDGRVSLSGTVGSAAERRRSYADAWVLGVDAVDTSKLTVADWARERYQRKQTAVKPDAAIEKAVGDALFYDPRAHLFELDVSAEAGTVTLRGTVDNVAAKQAAAQVARNTVGVHRVINDIKVRPSTPTDAEIERRLSDSMLLDPHVESYQVDVDVSNGVATLSGEVDTFFEKSQAHAVAATVYGVEEIRNNLDVRHVHVPLVHEPYAYYEFYYPSSYDWYAYEPPLSRYRDAELREEIDDELFWSPFVDADQVTVTVDDGVATLTGAVDSWSELNAATENAYEGGAVWVDNELLIKTP